MFTKLHLSTKYIDVLVMNDNLTVVEFSSSYIVYTLYVSFLI